MADVEGAKATSIVFRIAAFSLSVAAAVVMATASQNVVVDGGHGPSIYVVSYNHYSALAYFVAAGAISAVCSAVALYLSAVHTEPAGSGALVPLLDAVAQGLLFSAAGAAWSATRLARGEAEEEAACATRLGL
ncbi:CASP-like protein 1U1 [Phragmites australis]|uniref:CASP-like protein 1U1 n=1 Tax=Phragmites australis TaxID=29695 RepID=UPI002D76EAFF|nr:CASP-like protein 1U1 [Phragmites australis]